MLISFWYAQNNVDTNILDYSQKLAWFFLQQNKPTSMRSALYNYCNGVLNTSAVWLNVLWDSYYYSAKDSVFVYMICNNISSNFDNIFSKDFNSSEEWYFIKSSFEDFWIVDYTQNPDFDYCWSGSSLSYCDLTYHIPRVFDMIINDIFSVQQSKIYWLTNLDFEQESREDQVDKYALDKFNIKFCDFNEWLYPKLCKTMKNYVKASSDLLKNLNILNYDSIYKKIDEWSFTKCHSSFWKYDFEFLSCSLFGYWFGMNSMFLNMVYNEFLYYLLFTRYYNYIILENPGLAPLSHQKDNQTAINYLRNQSYEFNKAVNTSQKWISLSMKMLRELDFTFPLHVWFMMYQEDLLNLRDKSLYKIVTPFYTLHWKLRNVQTTN